MAANFYQPVEVYGAGEVGVAENGIAYPVLVGCYKSPEHLEWILSRRKYNVRMGDRRGSMEEFAHLFDALQMLVLYDVNNPSAPVKTYRLSNPRKLSGAELNLLSYPNAKPEYEYELFEISHEREGDAKHQELVASVMAIHGHREGAPVIITE